jgi:hypothetical protein
MLQITHAVAKKGIHLLICALTDRCDIIYRSEAHLDLGLIVIASTEPAAAFPLPFFVNRTIAFLVVGDTQHQHLEPRKIDRLQDPAIESCGDVFIQAALKQRGRHGEDWGAAAVLGVRRQDGLSCTVFVLPDHHCRFQTVDDGHLIVSDVMRGNLPACP